MKNLLTPNVKEVLGAPKFWWGTLIITISGILFCLGFGYIFMRLIHLHELQLGYLSCTVLTILVVPALSFRIFSLSFELTKAKDDLSRSNRELEQYAYVVSHDLQEPLRMVSSFCKKLDETYRDRFDDKAKEYMHQAVEGADRMQALIKELLARARAEKRDMEIDAAVLKNVFLPATVKTIVMDPQFWRFIVESIFLCIFITLTGGYFFFKLIHLQEVQLGYLCCVVLSILVTPVNTFYLSILSFDLARAKEDLSRSNKGLEEYAYVVSHDLQEPLKAVAGHCRQLEESYGEHR